MLDFSIKDIIHLDTEQIDKLEKSMEKATGKTDVVKELEEDLHEKVKNRLQVMGLETNSSAEDVIEALVERINVNERELYNLVGIQRGDFDNSQRARIAFEKLSKTAYDISTATEGFFLKKEKAEEILRTYPPDGTLKFFDYKDVDELLEKQDIMDVMSALRFTESKEWMHQAFDEAYGNFTSDDFEHRKIELRMMGPEWEEIAKKFVEKKHHNVSHLKEFGIIFLNPINQSMPGSLMRDFALFFHYFHEVDFYSKLFEHNSDTPDFAERLKSLLRGDVPEKNEVEPGEWLIVQRYLWKINAKDPRLFLPRVNPEALHWHKGEQNLVEFGNRSLKSSLEFWDDLDWVGGYFTNQEGESDLVSFDLEDNAMNFVASSAGKSGEEYGYFRYHQQEAVWNELFRRYVGYDTRDQLIVNNFQDGSIRLL